MGGVLLALLRMNRLFWALRVHNIFGTAAHLFVCHTCLEFISRPYSYILLLFNCVVTVIVWHREGELSMTF